MGTAGGPARRINIAAAIARRTSGQIVFAGMSTRMRHALLASLLVMSSRLIVSPRRPSVSDLAVRKRFLVVSIKTSFGFRSKVGRTPPRLNSIRPTRAAGC